MAVTAIGLIVGGSSARSPATWAAGATAVIMRVLDVLIAFPALVLAVAIAERLGPGEVHTIWALCFFSVPALARIARAATLRVREQNYIVAARPVGQRAWRARWCATSRRTSCPS